MKRNLSLPNLLEPYRKQIESSTKPFIRIRTKAGSSPLYESKFSGFPYLPKGFAHPLDQNGLPMRLLAQYRLDKIPPLPDMPTEGMLQFFLSQTDGVFGYDFNNLTKPDHFRVIYHPTVTEDLDQLETNFSYLSFDEEEEEGFPIDQEYALSFELSEEVIGLSDYRFEQLPISFDEDKEDDIWDAWETLSNDGHKIGGYAVFTQTDPRDGKEYKDYSILLLQIDSEEEDGIMWGDSGVGNFFIRPEDLRKRDFTRVLYTWDCC